MDLIVIGLLSLLRVLIVRSDEAENGEPGVVEKNEDRPELEDAQPNMSNLLGDPLCVVEIGDLHAQVRQVDETACEPQSVNNGLFARVWVKLIEVALSQYDTLVL